MTTPPAQPLLEREPVRVLLNGLAGVVNAVLIALKLTGAIDLDNAAIAAIVTAVTTATALAGEIVRTAVYAPANIKEQ